MTFFLFNGNSTPLSSFEPGVHSYRSAWSPARLEHAPLVLSLDFGSFGQELIELDYVLFQRFLRVFFEEFEFGGLFEEKDVSVFFFDFLEF